MSDPRLRRLLAEKMRRKARDERINFEDLCFGPQRAFVMDPSKYTMACCSRRAGKSFGVAVKLLRTGFDHPKARSLYVAMSRQLAKDTIWPAFEWLNDQYDLGLVKKENTGDIVLPNEHRILLRGAGSRREVEKFRGPKYVGACVDEAQGFNSLLEYMIDEVIEPATLDYDDSWIAVTGTPNAACSGPFFNMWHDISKDADPNAEEDLKGTPTWSKHHWTFFDNEWINDAEGKALRVRQRRKWREDTPKYVREYRGRWIKDSDGTAYNVQDHNLVYAFPEHAARDWRYVVGVDLGINDPCAWVVIAWSRRLGEAYVLESFEKEVENTLEAAAHTQRLREKYSNALVVADSGGIGKAFVADWGTISGIPVTSARKSDKGGRVSMVNGDLLAGKLKIVAPKNRALLTDLALLQWDDDALDRGKFVYANGFRDHLPDALQYAFTECGHHHSKWARERQKTQADYYRELEEAMEEAQIKRVGQAKGRTWRDLRREWSQGRM